MSPGVRPRRRPARRARRLSLSALITLCACLASASAPPAAAHETDQFSIPPDREFAELGPYITGRAHACIERGVKKANRRIEAAIRRDATSGEVLRLQAPDRVADDVSYEFPYAIWFIEDLDGVTRSPAMARRFPGQVVGYQPTVNDSVRRYIELSFNPFRSWGCSTIKLFGVYVGTDKVGHFADMGMHYYRGYREARARGMVDDDALRAGMNIGVEGIISEAGLLGIYMAGAYSNGDLASNYSGMLFYKNLTDPASLKGQTRPPMLVRDGPYWRVAPHVRADSDFFSYFVSEHWDEALNPSLYRDDKRKGIRRAVAEVAGDVLDARADLHGNRRPREWFVRKQTELTTYWGVDYGHRGRAGKLITIADTCYPRAPDPATAKPTDRDAFGWTPLHHAAAAGDVAALRRLLDAGGEVNAQVRSDERRSPEWGNTPLHYAARDGRAEAVRLLIEREADVNSKSDLGAAPLHRAIAHAEVTRLLLAHGAQTDAPDARGRTPLHWAAIDPAAQSAGVLLAKSKRRAKPDARDRDARTPLHLAARAANAGMAWLLLEEGASPAARDQFGVTPLHLAAQHTGVLTRVSSQQSAETVAELLLSRGANAAAADDFGRTPLHDAARGGSERIAAALLSRGADAAAADAYGTTPLHVAAREGRARVARLLLDHGAAAGAVARSGRTPADEAAAAGQPAVAKLLREAAAGGTATLASETTRAPESAVGKTADR